MDNNGELLRVLIESILFFTVDMYIEVLNQLRWRLLCLTQVGGLYIG